MYSLGTAAKATGKAKSSILRAIKSGRLSATRKDGAVCASLKGLLWEPCFHLVQTDAKSFRGSIRGLDFAYCSFTAHNPGTKTAPARSGPLPLGAFKGTGRSR